MNNFVEKVKPDISQSLINKLLLPVKTAAELLTTGVLEVLEEGVEAVQHETTTELHSIIATASGLNGHSTIQSTPKK